MPNFSIVVPVYNIERKHLEAALNSMLSQTFTDWECICVDDGSTDDSGVVLDEFAAKDNRFKVYHTRNQGVGAARNFALKHATGEWIMFLDGDDLYAPSTLHSVDLIATKYAPCKIVRFWYQCLQEDETWEHTPVISQTDGLFDLTKVIPLSLYAFSVWTFAFHKSIVIGNHFHNYKIGEDTIFALECIKDAKCYAYTTQKLYGYRQRSTSACHNISAKGYLDLHKTYIHRLKIFETDKRINLFYTSPSLIRYLSHDFVLCIKNYSERNEREMLWREWFNSLDFLANRKEFGILYHYSFKICNLLHSKLLSYLVSGVALAIAWRLHLHCAKALNPNSANDDPMNFVALDGIDT